jgi:hypothetical protein
MEYRKTKTGKENITQNSLLQLWGHPAQSRCLKVFFSSKIGLKSAESYLCNETSNRQNKTSHSFVIF